MEGLRRSKRVKVLSNVVLSEQNDNSSDGVSDSADKDDEQWTPSTASKTELSKNLFFELPTAQSSAQKRKLSASSANKRKKRAKPSAEPVTEKFEEETVFNYLTGKYETVRKPVGLISEEVIIKPDEEDMVEASSPPKVVNSTKTTPQSSNINQRINADKPSENQSPKSATTPVYMTFPKLMPKLEPISPRSVSNNNNKKVLYFLVNTNNVMTPNTVNSVQLQSNVTNLNTTNTVNLLSNPNNVITSTPSTMNLMTLNGSNTVNLLPNTNNIVIPNSLAPNTMNLVTSDGSNTVNLLPNTNNIVMPNSIAPNTVNLMTSDGSGSVNLLPNAMNTNNLITSTGAGTVNLLPNASSTNNLVTTNGGNPINLLASAVNPNHLLAANGSNTIHLLSNATNPNNSLTSNDSNTIQLLTNATNPNNSLTSNDSNTIQLLSNATNPNNSLTSNDSNTIQLLSNATIPNISSTSDGSNTVQLLSNVTTTNQAITSNGSSTVNLASVTNQDNSVTFDGSKTVSLSSNTMKQLTFKTASKKLVNSSIIDFLSKKSPSLVNPEASSSVNPLSNTAEVVDITGDETENSTEHPEPCKSKKTLTQKLEELKGKTITWKCKTCGLKTETKKDLIAHIYEQHLKTHYEIKVKCKQCSFECGDKVEMQRHEANHKMDETIPNVAMSSAASPSNSDAPILYISDTEEPPIKKERLNITEARIVATVDLTSDTDEMPSVSSPSQIDEMPSDSSQSQIEEMPSVKSQSKSLAKQVEAIQKKSSKESEPIAKCYDCDTYMQSTHIRPFEKHVHRHYGSKFQCLDHIDISQSRCLKCNYERVLNRIKKELKVCKQCGYQTFRLRYMTTHREKRMNSCKGTIYLNNIKLKPGEISCFGCKYITSHKNLLYYHMVDHLDKSYECYELHPTVQHDCPKCANVTALNQAKKDVQICKKCDFKSLIPLVFENHMCITKETDKTQETVKQNDKPQPTTISETDVRCFDCKFTCPKKSSDFEKHVLIHVGSKFQCIAPHNSDSEDCLKCHYEAVLSNISKAVKTCQTCGYRTLDEPSLKAHSEGEGECTKWLDRTLDAREMRCLMCQYTTTHKKFLKYHMIDHLEETVTCDVHGETADYSCEKCVNRVSLEGAKKEAIVCEKCNFKSAIKHVFNIHKCIDGKPFKTVDSSDKTDIAKKKDIICEKCNFKSAIKHDFNSHKCIDGKPFKSVDSSDKIDNAKKKAIICEKCNFKSRHKDVFNRHKCIGGKRAKPVDSSGKIVSSGKKNDDVTKSRNKHLKNQENSVNKDLNAESLKKENSRKSLEETEAQTIDAIILKISGDKNGNMDSSEVSEPQHTTSLVDKNDGDQKKAPNGECCSNDNEKGEEDIEAQTMHSVNPVISNDKGVSMESSEVISSGDQESNMENSEVSESLHSNNLKCSGEDRGQNKVGDIECLSKDNNEKSEENIDTPTMQSINPIISGDQESSTENSEVSESRHSNNLESSGDKEGGQNKVPDVECCSEKSEENIDTPTMQSMNPIISGDEESSKENSEVSESRNSNNQESSSTKEGGQNKVPDVECCSEKSEENIDTPTMQSMNPIISGDEESSKENSEVSESRNSNNQESSSTKEGGQNKVPDVECHSNDNNEKGLENIDAQTMHSENPIISDDNGGQESNMENSEVSESRHPNNLESSGDKDDDQNKVGDVECSSNDNNEKGLENIVETTLSISPVISSERDSNMDNSGVSGSQHSNNLESSGDKDDNQNKVGDVECSSNDNNEKALENIVETSDSISPVISSEQDSNMDNSEVSGSQHSNNVESSGDKVGDQNDVKDMKCFKKDNNGESLARNKSHSTKHKSSVDKDDSSQNKDGDVESRKDHGSAAKNSKIMAKCYDCKFSRPKIDISYIKHVCLHIGSKYQCVKHWNNKLNYCIQCNYEVTLQTLEKEAVACRICGFKAVCEASLRAHLQEFGSCSNWAHRTLQIGEISCLECQYATTHKKFLKYHMVDHLQWEFSCELHRKEKNAKCEKCINEKCLRDAKKEVNICEKCNFKTVIKQIFQLHESECSPEKEQENTGDTDDPVDFPIPYVYLEKLEL